MSEKKTVEVVVECWIVAIYERGRFLRSIDEPMKRETAEAMAADYSRLNARAGRSAVAFSKSVAFQIPRAA